MRKRPLVLYILFTTLALALYGGRIALTRARLDSGLVPLFQPQALLSLLYFLYVLVMLRILLRKPARPRWLFALLLLLPLAEDAWYLHAPALSADIPLLGLVPAAQYNLYAKCLLVLIGLFVGFSAKKAPADT